MTDLPVISIVVPSYNQGQYIAETLQSLVDQQYPNLQVIIQDGLSTDSSISVAEAFVERHPGVFELHVEKDAGQADAINRGFARAHGTILAFLNSDDVLHPGTLHRVASEIDPARNRYVVMGRSMFTGENSRYVGVEHPAEYISHFEHLAIWKRGYNTIPQPSVFWHASVTQRVGWLDVNEHHALDYDLFSRFSRHYRFHRIDEIFSDYRMHDESKSAQRTEAEVLALSIGVSKKHWGSKFSPLYWRLFLSHWAYSHHYHDHARHHARHAEQSFRERRIGAAGLHFFATLRYSPRMARDRLLFGWLSGQKVRLLRGLVARDMAFKGQYADAWIGPIYSVTTTVPDDSSRLQFDLEYVPQAGHGNFEIRLVVQGDIVDRKLLDSAGPFTLSGDVASLRGQSVKIDVLSDSSFVPREVLDVDDDRQLSVRLSAMTFS